MLRDRFELVEVIGRGGLSTVYRAVDHVRRDARAADPEIALKITDIGEGYGIDAAILLHREGRRLMELSHPNIVRVHDFDRDGPLHFIVMELLRGRTLAAILQERRGEPLARDLAHAVLDAVGRTLAAVHRAGMIHGDVKPGNVFVTREGRIKLIDFGTAQPLDAPDHLPEPEATVILAQRLRAVTPAYASPGMLVGHAPEPMDDVFSYAVMAYVLLAGQHPFEGRAAGTAKAEGIVPDRPAALDGATWAALRAGLSFDAQERPSDVGTFAQSLTATSPAARLMARMDSLARGSRGLVARVWPRRKLVKPPV